MDHPNRPPKVRVRIGARRLELTWPDGRVTEHPVAVGRPDAPTPTGSFTVRSKRLEPTGAEPEFVHVLELSTPRFVCLRGTPHKASLGTAASGG